MKRFTRAVLTALTGAGLLLGLTACNWTPDAHVHSYSEDWTYDETNHWHEATCGDTDTVSGKASHSWDSGTVTKEAGCTETGEMKYTCTVCGATKTETIAALGHSYSEEVSTAATYFTKGELLYTCSGCGDTYTEEILEVYSTPIDVNTENAATSESEYVYFGVFPQSAKDDSVAVNEDTSLTIGENTYYKGDDDEYYAKVSSSYYKVEPIKWKILKTDYDLDGDSGDETACLLVAENLLTSVPYYTYGTNTNTRTVGEDTGIYPCNYKYSQIRAYLNGLTYYYDTSATETTEKDDYKDAGFLQTAFTQTAQNVIATTEVDNESGLAEEFVCENTSDKIFLLSYKEVQKDYLAGTTTDEVKRSSTAYAKARGSTNNDYWWYRTPSWNYEIVGPTECYDYAYIFANDLINQHYYLTNFANYGVCPALCLSLE